jgi:hypothetical protein
LGTVTFAKIRTLWKHSDEGSKRFVVEMQNGRRHDFVCPSSGARERWTQLLNAQVSLLKAEPAKAVRRLCGVVHKKSARSALVGFQLRVLELCKQDRRLLYYKDMDACEAEELQGAIRLDGRFLGFPFLVGKYIDVCLDACEAEELQGVIRLDGW